MTEFWPFVYFNIFVLAMLALDLGVFHRKAHKVSIQEAALWTLVWVTLALLFGAGVYLFRGSEAGLAFFAGYLMEKALSVDNVFVFIVIFSYFKIPEQFQHRVLFVGILSALVMRAAMIIAGVYMIHHFHWMTYVFGGFLIVTGLRLLRTETTEVTSESNKAVRLIQSVLPVTNEFHDQKFFVRQVQNGTMRWYATPLLSALIVIEFTDLVFALDSIPAVMAITLDPFLIYTSNVFAILGLRSLYFLFSNAMTKLRFLHMGLAAVLCFVGIKMLVAGIYEIPVHVSLIIIGVILATAIVASLLKKSPSPGVKRTPEHRAPLQRK